MPRGLTATLFIALFLSSISSLRAQVVLSRDLGLFPAPTLGALVKGARHVAVLEVESVAKGERTITFRKAADLKGGAPAATVRHRVADPNVLAWAAPGRVAVWFVDGDRARVCLGNHWYQCERQDGTPPTYAWQHTLDEHGQTYVGPAERLREHVAALLDGKEVIVTARAPRDEFSLPWVEDLTPRDWRYGKKGDVWRVRASLRILGFAAWLTEDAPQIVGRGVGNADALPGLIRALSDADPHVRAEAAVDLGQLGSPARDGVAPLTAALRDADGHVRVYAAEALGLIDPRHRDPVTVLSEALAHRDPALRTAAADALVSLGPRAEAAIPDLLGLLQKDADPGVRRTAAYALGQIAPEAETSGRGPKDVAAALGRVLEHDRSARVRLEALEALPGFGADAQAALPSLAAVLEEQKDVALAYRTADLLRRFGSAAAPALAAALPQGDTVLRQRLLGQLGALGPTAAAARPSVELLLGDRDEAIAVAAADALVRIDPDAAVKTAVPLLRKLLAHEDGTVRRAAADALGDLGPRAAAARPELLVLARTESPELRLPAVVALERVTGRTEPTVAVLLALADGKGRVTAAVQRRAWQALGRLGPDARMVLPALRQYLAEPEAPQRPAAALVLWRIEWRRQRGCFVVDPTPEVVGVLDGLLRQRQQVDDVLAVLRVLGPEARGAVGRLLTLLRDESPAVRKGAIETLAAIGPDARAASAALRERLKDEVREVRLAAAVALARVRPDDPESLARLVRLAERTPYPEVSLALSAFGPRARVAVPALRRALRHPLYEVHAAAAEALRRITRTRPGST